MGRAVGTAEAEVATSRRGAVYTPPRHKPLTGRNFYYSTSVDYDTYRDCDYNGCSYICRCSTIENARVKSVSVLSVAEHALESVSPSAVYAGYRLLQQEGLGDLDEGYWYVSICGGYYGEEIDSVNLDSSTTGELDDKLAELLAIPSDSQRLLWVLNRQWEKDGPPPFKLPDLSRTVACVETVPAGSLLIDQEMLERSPGARDIPMRGQPIAVGYEDGGKVRVIDGFDQLKTARSCSGALPQAVTMIILRDPQSNEFELQRRKETAGQHQMPLVSLIAQTLPGAKLTITSGATYWQYKFTLTMSDEKGNETEVATADGKKPSECLRQLAEQLAVPGPLSGKGLRRLDRDLEQMTALTSSRKTNSFSLTLDLYPNGAYALVPPSQTAARFLRATEDRRVAFAALRKALS